MGLRVSHILLAFSVFELASRDWRDWRAGVTLTPMANGWPSHQESSPQLHLKNIFNLHPNSKTFFRDREVVFDGRWLMAGPAIRIPPLHLKNIFNLHRNSKTFCRDRADG